MRAHLLIGAAHRSWQAERDDRLMAEQRLRETEALCRTAWMFLDRERACNDELVARIAELEALLAGVR